MPVPEGLFSTWNRKHAYALGLICLLAGLAVVLWWGRSATSAPPPRAQAALTAPAPVTAAIHQMQSPDQVRLRRFADQQAQPLLLKLQQTPHDPALLADIAGIYYQTRQFPDAADYYGKSLASRDDPEVRTRLGGVYFYAGDYDRATAEFERVLKTDPKNANALYNLGMTRWQGKGDAAGAVAAWQRLLKLNPGHPRRTEVEGLIAVVQKHAGITEAPKVANP